MKGKMKVVVCEPNKKAYVAEIGRKLADLQEVVGGCIEAFYPFATNEAIVCNEEGKINGMSPCRAIYDDDGEMVDIVFGTFFICDCGGEGFDSLSEEKLNEYCKKYEYPEHYYRVNGEIKTEKYNV